MAAHFWFIYALSAAVMWGLGYVISEKLLRIGMTPAFMMVISNIVMLPFLIGMTAYMDAGKGQLQLFLSSKEMIALTLFMGALIIGGNLLILTSIQEKNATLASLIEITYPIFTCLFAWIFLKETQVNWAQAAGGVLIFSGVCLIYLKS
jgi:drug/metabolite transporter (DMT)-like permease